VVAGLLLRAEPHPRRRLHGLATGGLALVAAGLALSAWIPVNKPLWTPSYAALMAGLAAIGLAACYWLVDVRQWARWSKPFEILGRNAVTAYLISRPIDHLLRIHVLGRSVPDVFRRLASPPNASLMFALVVLLAVQAVAWAMYRQRWFVKL
jgi:predicted acyltransferase